MPVHCGTRQLLKEPDVLPKFTYLFEKEFVNETTEVSFLQVCCYNFSRNIHLCTPYMGRLINVSPGQLQLTRKFFTKQDCMQILKIALFYSFPSFTSMMCTN